MAGRVQIKPMILLLLIVILPPASALEPSYILVSYSFDDNNIVTGPDTFAVFEKGKGSVSLTTSYKFSGYYSVEISDVKGDKEFPELQGYFKPRKKGKLFVHFAFMTTDQYDLLNIALAGPAWFTLQKNGIGFWLKTEKGYLYHVSDSIPKKLFYIREFTWYVVDVTYDIDRGVYDLVIHQEGAQDPIASLKDQKNAPNQPGSAVDKFSFVTDPFQDKSSLTYYVDDVVIGIDKAIVQLPFVAPGRRKLFVDIWNEYQMRLRQKPGCIPAAELTDFGITEGDISALKEAGLLGLLSYLLEGQKLSDKASNHLSGRNYRILQAVETWKEGCAALSKGDATAALQNFDKAISEFPEGKIYRLSRLLTLASLKRWKEVDSGLSWVYSDWQDDMRLAVAQAMIGVARGDLDSAEYWLQSSATHVPDGFGEEAPNRVIVRLWGGEIDMDLINDLKHYYPDDWQEYIEKALIAEEYYYVLLWKGLFNEAESYALRMVERLEFLAAPTSKWLERAGDAALFLEKYPSAQQLYKRSLEGNPRSASVLLKLSDVHFLLGDEEKERFYRERIYGRLIEE
ncbi:MAG TPA: tetratricopeptide repeat protein [Thermodesulfobacteriota bacterium]|nr:tetratricopeptide repeat protein [Thermodesulfobacteriota bacterium]